MSHNIISSINKEEIANLPIATFPGTIILVENPDSLVDAITALSTQKYVGFDTETRPNFSKKQHHKVSLIQIATNETCYLFRLNRLGGIPKTLSDFLENEQVTKIGLSLLDDFHAIRKYIPSLEPAGFIDLQKFVSQYGIKDSSLQKIYAILFGEKISKRSRLSNWESEELTEAQLAYASLDAWACLRIYTYLCQL